MLASRAIHAPKTEPLRCANCGFPYAVVRDGVLIIKSMHRGVIHTNRISVAALVDMCKEETETVDGTG